MILPSAAPCVSGDELQRCVDSSSGMLVRYVPPAAQQDPPHQSDVSTEPDHQPGHGPAHSSLLSLRSLQGDQPALMEFKGLEVDLNPSCSQLLCLSAGGGGVRG